MEESKRKEIKEKLNKLSSMVSDVRSELHSIAGNYYSGGSICDKFRSMAIDADELCYKLLGAVSDEDDVTTTCNLMGEDVEIIEGDIVGYITWDGKVYQGTVIEITPGNGSDDVLLTMVSKVMSNDTYHIKRVVRLDYCRFFEKIGWNKLIDSLASQKKWVSLLQHNGLFSLTVKNEKSEILLEREYMSLFDFNENLKNELNEL